ncbi:MAG: hypothetical protein ACREVE_05930 [Gammaproteobacteria bacterium]
MIRHPADQLAALLEAFDADTEIPREVRGWLHAGLRDYLKGTDLERALGLAVGPGQSHAHVRNLMFRARRDRLIRETAAMLPGSIHGRAVRVARAIQTFGKGGEELPGPVLETVARLIFENGVHVPRSSKQVERILKGETLASRLSMGRQTRGMCP